MSRPSHALLAIRKRRMDAGVEVMYHFRAREAAMQGKCKDPVTGAYHDRQFNAALALTGRLAGCAARGRG